MIIYAVIKKGILVRGAEWVRKEKDLGKTGVERVAWKWSTTVKCRCSGCRVCLKSDWIHLHFSHWWVGGHSRPAAPHGFLPHEEGSVDRDELKRPPARPLLLLAVASTLPDPRGFEAMAPRVISVDFFRVTAQLSEILTSSVGIKKRDYNHTRKGGFQWMWNR